MLKKALLTPLIVILQLSQALACVSQQEVLAAKTPIQSSILFYKTSEYYALLQHLTYYQGRPYFNYSLCIKDMQAQGFSLERASHYDLNKDCHMLGQWSPVYGPQGEEVFSEYFFHYLQKDLDEYFSTLKRREKLAPFIDSFKTTLSDFNDLLLLAAGAQLVRQAYLVAPFANNVAALTTRKGEVNMRKLGARAGWFFMLVGAVGMAAESYKRNEDAKVHRQKLQATIKTLEVAEREMNLLEAEGEVTDKQSSYPFHVGIVDKIVKAFAEALIQLNEEQGWICEPMVPLHERKQETRKDLLKFKT